MIKIQIVDERSSELEPYSFASLMLIKEDSILAIGIYLGSCHQFNMQVWFSRWSFILQEGVGITVR